MAEWTPDGVEERLRKAIALKPRLLPRGGCQFEAEDNDAMSRPAGKGIGTIGGIGVSAADTDGDDVVVEAVEALSWLHWLEASDARIVIARLEGARWKMICWRFGLSRPTADRRWRYALSMIAWHLNGHAASRAIPSLRSMLNHRAA